MSILAHVGGVVRMLLGRPSVNTADWKRVEGSRGAGGRRFARPDVVFQIRIGASEGHVN